jgi:hypothetical protein
MNFMRRNLAFSLAGVLFSSTVGLHAPKAEAEEVPEAVVFWSGVDFGKDSSYIYDGLIVAMNRDISKDGFLLRFSGSLAQYEYLTISVPGGKVDGDQWQADAMIGYQFVRGHTNFHAFVGVDYKDIRLSPDDVTAVVRGTETGVKVAARLEVNDPSPVYFSLAGEYSTAFNSYWANVRLGLNVHKNKFIIGPSGSVIGIDGGYDAQRLGGFAKFLVNLTPNLDFEVTGYAGYQFVRDQSAGGGAGTAAGPAGGQGAYGGITLGTAF